MVDIKSKQEAKGHQAQGATVTLASAPTSVFILLAFGFAIFAILIFLLACCVLAAARIRAK